ncbi:lipopolysaccharide biosynthesis protein [Gemmatimonadota bacterium]
MLTGNAVYAASQWGMLIILAKLGSAEMVGQFALGLAVTAPIFMFSNLQLRAVQATDSIHEYQFIDYFRLRIMTTILALAVIVTIALTAYHYETALLIVLIGTAKAFESLSDVVYGLLQQRERMDRIAKAYYIKGPTSFIAFTIGMIITDNVVGAVIGMLLVWGLVFFIFDLFSAHQMGERQSVIRSPLSIRRLRQLSWMALPMGFVMMLISLNTNIPRIVIEHFLGEAQLGFFSAIAYMIIAGDIIVVALGQAAAPRLSLFYSSNRRSAYWRLLLRLILLAIGIGVVGLIIAHQASVPLLTLLYGQEYATHANLFFGIMVAASINYIVSVTRYAVIVARTLWLEFMVSIGSLLSMIISCYLLIPNMGLMGAVYALIITNMISLIMKVLELFWIARKFSRFIGGEGSSVKDSSRRLSTHSERACHSQHFHNGFQRDTIR